MKTLIVILGATLSAGTAQAEVGRALPRAYVGLASVGVALGYHGLSGGVYGNPLMWLGFEGSVVEGTYFLMPRLGVGLVAGDLTVNQDFTNGVTWFNTSFILAPTISYLTNSDARSFGYATLKLMPYTPGSQPGGASIGLDWGYVPFAPWPLEGHAGLEATLSSWTGSDRQILYHANAGVRVGLGYWLMRR